MSKKVYEIITNKIIQSIQDVIDGKEELLPWQKPWTGGKVNYITGKSYRGINLLLLPENGEYITFTQISKLRERDPSIKLKKGCKKHMVVYWNIVKKEEDNKEITYPLLRYYYVYHINDVEGLESKIKAYEHKSNEEIEKVIEDYSNRALLKIDYVNGSSRAFYSPSRDYVNMPTKEQFENIEEFYSTLFHELAHSTGHPSRLNRFNSNKVVGFFGSETYSKEELVAELSAQMTLGMLGVENKKVEQNSLSYLHGWMKVIEEDVRLIVSASSQAQKATDYILNIKPEEEN